MSSSCSLHPLALSALALALAGCAAPAPEAWRVEPNYRVSHAGPGMAQGYAALARQYEGERRWSDALQAWRRAATEAPDDVDVLDALGVALAGQGRYEESVMALQRAVALAPQSARLHNNLGYALILAGRAEEARDPLRTAVLLDPAHAMARANLQRVEPAGNVAQSTVTEEVAAAPEVAPAARRAAEPVAEPPLAPQAQLEPDTTPLPMAEVVVSPVNPGSVPPIESRADVANPEPTPEPPAAQVAAQTPLRLQHLQVEIANGNGFTGMAAWVGSWLQRSGLGQRPRLTNQRPYATLTTVVYYRSGFAAEAQQIAQRMPRPASVAEQAGGNARSDVRVVLGHDLREPLACTPECRSKPGLALAVNDGTRR